MPNMKPLSLAVLKVMANVKVDNRQTGQTNRQDKINMPPVIRYGGIKNQDIRTCKRYL